MRWETLCGSLLTTAYLTLIALVGYANAEEKTDGKTLFVQYGCDVCHSVQAVGIVLEESEDGDGDPPPDLSDFGSQGHDAEAVESFLRKKAELNGLKHAKRLKAPKNYRQALVAWLLTLKLPAEDEGVSGQ